MMKGSESTVWSCSRATSRNPHPRKALPHSGLRIFFWWLSHRKSVTLSIGTPLCPYPIAYRRAYGLSFRWTVFKNLRSPMCGRVLLEKLLVLGPFLSTCISKELQKRYGTRVFVAGTTREVVHTPQPPVSKVNTLISKVNTLISKVNVEHWGGSGRIARRARI